jgi:SAM-dependent methyltransferase
VTRAIDVVLRSLSRWRMRKTALLVYRAICGGPPDEVTMQSALARLRSGTADWTTLAHEWAASQEALDRAIERAMALHLHLIHQARLRLVRTLLPPADRILDLGGANAPLYRMGYRHRFRKLVLVDLPAQARHGAYGDVSLERTREGGEVSIHYGDMTKLEDFADASFDLVWSGQSIEHVSRADGERMCREAYRVLGPGGHFCLDTPNRLITSIHTAQVGGGFIHPEHKVEYEPAELRALLNSAGFNVVAQKGVCEMPRTCAERKFHYEDFVLGAPICDRLDCSYIQYFHCRRPT